MQIELTKSQCDNLADLIDLYFFTEIRENDEIDNMGWVYDIATAWNTLREASKGEDE